MAYTFASSIYVPVCVRQAGYSSVHSWYLKIGQDTVTGSRLGFGRLHGGRRPKKNSRAWQRDIPYKLNVIPEYSPAYMLRDAWQHRTLLKSGLFFRNEGLLYFRDTYTQNMFVSCNENNYWWPNRYIPSITLSEHVGTCWTPFSAPCWGIR